MKKLSYLFLASVTIITPLAAAEPANGTLIQISSVSIFSLIVSLYCTRKAAKGEIQS
ncbi:MAG: hypothetical protein ACPGN3_09180 [Opitutales bacterium]